MTNAPERTHLMTGAGSGIGRVIAERLRDRGDRLVLLMRNAERIDQLRPDFPQAVFVEADLARPRSLTGLGDLLPAALDSVIHAAGAVRLATVAETSLAAWEELVAVNLTAPALLTRECLPGLRAARGTVVFVNSTAGLSAGPSWSAYGAAKAGLRALAEVLRAEESSAGVRVTTVFPGRTATPMQEQVHRAEGRAYDPGDWIRAETVANGVVRTIDLPPDATITDLTIRPR